VLKPVTILPLSSLLIVACSGGAEEIPVDPLPAAMQIGVSAVGSEGFVAAQDGDEAILAPGSQGGFHLWTAPRFQGAMGTHYLDREARRVEDGVLVLRASRLVLDIPEDAMDQWWRDEQAFPSFMCPPPIGIQIYDSEIEFHFTLRTEDEELVAEDKLILMARCPEGEDGTYCRSTCEG
jgi:hypothetical protein